MTKPAGYLCNQCGKISHDPGGNCGHDAAEPLCPVAERDLFAGMADGLMAAGDRLAEKLRDIDDSPWTEQVLEEWQKAKTIDV